MIWRKPGNVKVRNLAFRAIFAAGCFAGFAIFGWDVPVSDVLEVILVIILGVLALALPAAAFVLMMKLGAAGISRLTAKEQKDD